MARPSGKSREGKIPIREHLMEFQQQYSANEQALQSELITVTGARPKSVREWLQGKGVPNGLMYLKVAEFLRRRGHFEPWADTDPCWVIDLHDLIIHDVVTVDAACLAGGMNRNQLFVLLRTGHRVSDDRRRALQSLLRNHQADVVKLRAVNGGSSLVMTQPTVVPHAQPAGVSTSPKLISDHAAVIATLGQLMQVTLPLAEIVASQRFSNQEREQLRAAISSRTIFKLANAIYALTGREARTILKTEGGR